MIDTTIGKAPAYTGWAIGNYTVEVPRIGRV